MATKKVTKNYNSYHIPGTTEIQRVKRSVVFLNRGNKVSHELAKSLGAIMLSKYGDLKFNKKIKKAIKKIEEELKNEISYRVL